ncbi:DNA alkylation repair protein [Paenibacillus urinalis]|uniref:DNA alkylation repair protein n=1 Tax=Paenibacillus urinalis TaxID=521520 RepID=A0ABY7XIH5_9BACL|nr:DNA alkylation repair protein [Paenibacillus urinalis]WDH96436.1 DNA alkylation repair protein [Paenibacillus urinalis]WDI04660.1 DNA alkylation repair protein [Paenibacillus urinalis]
MNNQLKEQLLALSDQKYQQFTARLIPNITNLLGVRHPELHKLAKTIAKGDWRTYLKQADDEYFEEVMLQAMVLGYIKTDIDELLEYVAAFIPKITNWSICDSFCSGLKITKKNKPRVWEFVIPYLSSADTYHIRFGVVMLLTYFVDEEYIEQVLQKLDTIHSEEYYVQMAVAWAISICYIKMPEQSTKYLLESSLDKFTYNKALQKITESYQVSAEQKELIRSMRRK